MTSPSSARRLRAAQRDELARGLPADLEHGEPLGAGPALHLLARMEGAVGRGELVVEEVPGDLEREPERAAERRGEEQQHADVPEREERDAQARVADPA